MLTGGKEDPEGYIKYYAAQPAGYTIAEKSKNSGPAV